MTLRRCAACGNEFDAVPRPRRYKGEQIVYCARFCPACGKPQKAKREYQREYGKGRTEYFRQYRQNNADAYRRHTSNRRTRKYNLPIAFTTDDWQFCLQYFDNRCAYCLSAEGLTEDHFIPVTLADCPGTVPTNIVPACKSCNSSKSNSDAYEWLSDRHGHDEATRQLSRIDDYFGVVLYRANWQKRQQATPARPVKATVTR